MSNKQCPSIHSEHVGLISGAIMDNCQVKHIIAGSHLTPFSIGLQVKLAFMISIIETTCYHYMEEKMVVGVPALKPTIFE